MHKRKGSYTKGYSKLLPNFLKLNYELMMVQHSVTKQIPLKANRKPQRVRLHRRVGTKYLHSHAYVVYYML